MPELPEVETVINYLKKQIINSKILDVEIKNYKFLKNRDLESFKNEVINKKILDIKRKGKYLIFVLSDDLFMISHLRMEGKYFVDDKIQNRKHDYLIFKLSNDKYLSYNDSRQFGTFHLTNDLNSLNEIKKVAIDPLDDQFSTDFLYKKTCKSKKNIKTL